MNVKEIILIGGGGHCKSCISVIESTNEYRIAGIIDTPDKVGQKVLGYPVIGHDEQLPELKEKYDYALITVGQITSAKLRMKLFQKAKNAGFDLPVIVASTAFVSKHTQIGEGTIIMHQAIINADTTIGVNNIINTKALIEHDCQIGNHNHISTASVLNGNVNVGDECFIGSNSTFVNGIGIKNNIFIGINSIVNKNLEDKGVYVGSPVKKIR